MLVFRCECEQVLGVDDESNKGGTGECPTCGRIIRVPQTLVNASGKLRLAGTPARAMAASGAFRQIKDALPKESNIPNGTGKPVGSQSGFTNSAPAIAASIAAAPTPAPVIAAPVTPPSVEEQSTQPVVKASSDAPTDVNPSSVAADVEAEIVGAASTVTAASATTSPNNPSAVGKAVKGGIAKRPPIKNQKFIPSKKDANDPNAAIETKNDRNIAAVANAAASKRAKAASGAAVPAKKNVMLIYMLAVVAIVIIVGVLFALGVFSGEPAKSNTTPTGSTAVKKETKPTTTPETKAATTPDVKPEPTDPAKAPEVKPPAEGEKKDPAAEPKTEEKKDEKKDPAADTKADDKK